MISKLAPADQREKLVPADQRRKSRGSTRIIFRIGGNQRIRSAKISGKNWFPQISAEKVADQPGSFLESAKISEDQREH